MGGGCTTADPTHFLLARAHFGNFPPAFGRCWLVRCGSMFDGFEKVRFFPPGAVHQLPLFNTRQLYPVCIGGMHSKASVNYHYCVPDDDYDDDGVEGESLHVKNPDAIFSLQHPTRVVRGAVLMFGLPSSLLTFSPKLCDGGLTREIALPGNGRWYF